MRFASLLAAAQLSALASPNANAGLSGLTLPGMLSFASALQMQVQPHFGLAGFGIDRLSTPESEPMRLPMRPANPRVPAVPSAAPIPHPQGPAHAPAAQPPSVPATSPRGSLNKRGAPPTYA
jgi:hypothetical protein